MEAAASAAAAKAISSPRKTKKSPNIKKKKRKPTDSTTDSSQRKTTISRLWTNEVKCTVSSRRVSLFEVALLISRSRSLLCLLIFTITFVTPIQQEDQLLNKVVTESDKPLKWPDVARSIPERSGKQCRERYLNHLAPGVNHREWTPDEDALIFRLHNIYGSKWTKISGYLSGRSDNSCKNRYALIIRRMNKDVSKGLRCGLDELKKFVMMDRIRSQPTASETVGSGKDSEFSVKIRSILPYLASVSVQRKGPPVSMYDFGPFRPALITGEQCRRCHLFAPSTHCGKAMCNSTGWCEACCNVPAYISGDRLRECLHLRKCQDEDRAAIQVESFGLPFASSMEV